MTPFWKSTRFWALIVSAVVYAANAAGWMPQELANALYVVLAGHIGIRTTDRFAEKLSPKKK